LLLDQDGEPMSDTKGNKDKSNREPPPTASFDSTVLGPGSQISQFRIKQEPGRGAVGVVYLSINGYPIRSIRTRQYLYIHNLTPEANPVRDRPGAVWPGNDPVGGFGDTDGGPAKTYLWENRDKYPQLNQLAFGKRPAEEPYDIKSDPFNMNNLAEDASYQEIKAKLADKLQQYLEQTKDPRAIGNAKLLDDIRKKYPVMESTNPT